MVHCWLVPPLQVHRWSWVPLAVLEPGSSRHLPEAGLTRAPLVAFHCWLAPPLQSHIWILMPSAVDWPLSSTHLALSSSAVIGPVEPLLGPPAGVTDRLS